MRSPCVKVSLIPTTPKTSLPDLPHLTPPWPCEAKCSLLLLVFHDQSCGGRPGSSSACYTSVYSASASPFAQTTLAIPSGLLFCKVMTILFLLCVVEHTHNNLHKSYADFRVVVPGFRVWVTTQAVPYLITFFLRVTFSYTYENITCNVCSFKAYGCC